MKLWLKQPIGVHSKLNISNFLKSKPKSDPKDCILRESLNPEIRFSLQLFLCVCVRFEHLVKR